MSKTIESAVLSALEAGFSRGPAIAEHLELHQNDRNVYNALQSLRKRGSIRYVMGHGWSLADG